MKACDKARKNIFFPPKKITKEDVFYPYKSQRLIFALSELVENDPSCSRANKSDLRTSSGTLSWHLWRLRLECGERRPLWRYEGWWTNPTIWFLSAGFYFLNLLIYLFKEYRGCEQQAVTPLPGGARWRWDPPGVPAREGGRLLEVKCHKNSDKKVKYCIEN